MKSKIYIIYLIITSFILFYSCEGDLEPTTFDQLSPDNYPESAEDVKAFVSGIYFILNTHSYGGFSDWGWQSRWVMNEATTDEFVCYWGGSVWETYSKFLWNSGSAHVTNKTYKPYIQSITNCVNAIEIIDGIEMNQELKVRYQAELRGIMAMLAYTLYDFYGPVPIVVDPEITMDASIDFKPERPSKEWMLNFIKTTARESADNLPLSYNSSDYGRITKGTSLMVLLKLAMHEKNWEQADAISKEIIDLNVYQLQNSYLSIFSVENEQNEEIVFAIPQLVSGDQHNNWLAHVLPSEYVEPNGIPVQKWGGYKVPWDIYDKFDSDDQRLASLWGEMNTVDGVVDIRSIDATWAQMGAVPYKYPADPSAVGTPHGNDKIVYRYADVLLLRAEALNNITPLSFESIDLINEIRDRAGADLIQASDFADQAALNDFILDERFRELFLEGHRREDLIRHGKYLSEAAKRGAVNTDQTRLIFPIPQSAIDANENISQNPGY